jgi:hypothetical protein
MKSDEKIDFVKPEGKKSVLQWVLWEQRQRVDWIVVSRDRIHRLPLADVIMKLRIPQKSEFLGQLSDY